MQLNIGEGKLLVIVPIIAVSLVDSNTLIRVIVLKASLKQIANMLIAKLRGLINRKVYYILFLRSLRLSKIAAADLDRMLKECIVLGGVLLV